MKTSDDSCSSILLRSSSGSSSSATILDDDSVTSATTEESFPTEEQQNCRRKVVRFPRHPIVQSIPNDRTVEEVQDSWISMQEHYQNRKNIRARQYRLFENPEYKEAINYVKRRLAQHQRRTGPVDIDSWNPEDNTDSSIDESNNNYFDNKDNNLEHHHQQLQEMALEALTLGDRRGLERAGLYGSHSKAIHARSIQEAYQKGMSAEQLAEICRKRSELALQWAQACKLSSASLPCLHCLW